MNSILCQSPAPFFECVVSVVDGLNDRLSRECDLSSSGAFFNTLHGLHNSFLPSFFVLGATWSTIKIMRLPTLTYSYIDLVKAMPLSKSLLAGLRQLELS